MRPVSINREYEIGEFQQQLKENICEIPSFLFKGDVIRESHEDSRDGSKEGWGKKQKWMPDLAEVKVTTSCKLFTCGV